MYKITMYSPCLLTYFYGFSVFDFRNIGVKLEHFKKLKGKLEFYQNKCHHENAPDMRSRCANSTDQWAQGVAGWPHFEAAHGFASQERSPGGSNKESKA
jgi:hypothetical protein